MRFCIVVSSDELLTSAGVRIRYGRMKRALDPSMAIFEIISLRELMLAGNFQSDVYIFCKCFTPEALIIACELKRRGKTVGQDVFDDYFSQHDDARLSRYRSWLRAAAAFLDFLVCSTSRLRDVLASYMPDIPTTVIGDPLEEFDPASVERMVVAKAARMRARRHISAVWFGMGDNPFFPVGVTDLVAQAAELARFRRFGWSIDLTVLTNMRALNAAGLGRLRRLPVSVDIREWSEEREAAALQEADLAFIPVNAQSFSRAKSMNRAITALCRGAFVLSHGYPLYEPLHPFIYRSAQELATDLEREEPKLRSDTIPRLRAVLMEVANPLSAAVAFVEAARRAVAKNVGSGRCSAGNTAPLCLIHGLVSSRDNHRLAKRFGGISVKSPFCNRNTNFQIRFDVAEDTLDVLVAEKTVDAISAELRQHMTHATTVHDHVFMRVPPDALGLRRTLPLRSVESPHLPVQLSAYRTILDEVVAACGKLLPGSPVLVSENNDLAYRSMSLGS
jgi:hypothetical protein